MGRYVVKINQSINQLIDQLEKSYLKMKAN